MNNNLIDELQKIENKIYEKCVFAKEFTGTIKTSLIEKPNKNDLLKIKSNLVKRINSQLDQDIIDVILIHKFYSYYDEFNSKCDSFYQIMKHTYGLAIPFMIPSYLYETYNYYTSKDYYYIEYLVIVRK
jgi:hypothetical protein